MNFHHPEGTETKDYLDILAEDWQKSLEGELLIKELLNIESINESSYIIDNDNNKWANLTYAFGAKSVESLKAGLQDLQKTIIESAMCPISFRCKLSIEETYPGYQAVVRYTEIGNPKYLIK